MKKLFTIWRYYSLGYEQYHECMERIHKNNLYNLRVGNVLAIVLAALFSGFPLLVNHNIQEAAAYLVISLFSLLLFIIANRNIKLINQQKRLENKRKVCILIILFFINVVFFGIFTGVLMNRDNYTVTFMTLLVCSLFLFYSSPVFNLCLIASATAVFITFTVLLKEPGIYIVDIYNVIFSALISLFICWRITMLRLVSELNAWKMEEERNKYLDQSTIDELTKLRNRRDFEQTFQRYLTNYRTSDDYLCVAIADIDFFKHYNDFYGHPKGDDCLRAIGGALIRLNKTMGVYCARVGGEEFALLWFEKDASHVDAVISRVTKLIKTLKIPHEKSNINEFVTMSIGVYIERCGVSNNYEELYDLADKALYSAKGNGRNCAIVRGRNMSQYQIKPE
ncbi:MAG: GGDEF domain-containing protein [Treponema sp.]|nr:GGDEF domain-containing protein [Treponema sp.]